MNKKMKILTECLICTSCLSIYSPVNLPLLTTKAYAEAATYSIADAGELKTLDVQSTDGQSLELCDNYGGKQKNLTDDKDYYVMLDGKNDGVKVSAEVQGEGYIAKVFATDGKSATPYDLGENIPVQFGQSAIYIRTYSNEDNFKRAVKDKDYTFCSKTYKINIQKSAADDSDNVSLETISLDSGEIPINFNRDTITYNISVDETLEDIEIKARPENEKCDVKIQDEQAYQDYGLSENNKYKVDLHLLYGLNVMKIMVTDTDYRVKTYTLNITRGKTVNKNNSEGTNTTKLNSNNQLKFNQWVQLNGSWQYYDLTGKPLKSTWYYDRNYCKNYYFNEDGTMAVNWLSLNGNWYYLGQDGGMKTGWQKVNGKYYYLQTNGIMAKNTEISGYKLGNDGAWIN